MPLDAEAIADRRRLRRKVTFWRVLAFLVLLVAVASAGVYATREGDVGLGQRHIARVSVDGLITGSQRVSDLLRRVGNADSVAGVVISIDSPGGTTTGSEELYRNIRRLAEKKPVVAFVDGTAASGGYIAALGADHIVARETSLVGSVGVLFQYPQMSDLLDKIGVQVEAVKSAPLKAEPSGVRPTPPEAREALQRVVNDTFEWFKGLVRERRRLDEAQLALVTTGTVFNGRQGLPLRLIDQVGTERDAVAWLERERAAAKDLPIRNWEPRSETNLDVFTLGAAGADLAGLEGLARSLRQIGYSAEAAKLDGLLALWHPAGEK